MSIQLKFIAAKARRTWWNKTEIKQNCRLSVGALFQPTVDSFVLFQFQGCTDAWNKVDHRQHCLTAFFYFRRSHIPETETLKLFRRVEKYANEAETVSVF